MSEVQKDEDNVWARISRINIAKCMKCGHANPLGQSRCEECMARLVVEEDEEENAFEVVEGPSRAVRPSKIPLAEAKTLNLLRKAAEGIKAQTMSPEEYNDIVARILNMARMGVALFETDLFKKTIGSLPEDEAALARKQHQEFKRFYKGVSLMAKYLETQDIKHGQEGFAAAEAAMTELDKIQDSQLAIVTSKQN